MLTLALALMLQGQGAEPQSQPRPQVYRWKNRAGQMFITTTTPPPGSTVLETHVHQNIEEVEQIHYVPPPTPEDIRARLESALSQETIQRFRGIDDALLTARQAGDKGAALSTIDLLLYGTLFTGATWMLFLFPFAAVVLCLLLAWWTSVGLSVRAKLWVWSSFALAGFILAHAGIQRALYSPQAKRMDFLLSMMPNYLGDYAQVDPETAMAMKGQAAALLKAAAVYSPPWAFPVCLYQARRAIREAVLQVPFGAALDPPAE